MTDFSQRPRFLLKRPDGVVHPWVGQKLVSLMIFSLPPCGVCRSPVPSVYSINYKRKKSRYIKTRG